METWGINTKDHIYHQENRRKQKLDELETRENKEKKRKRKPIAPPKGRNAKEKNDNTRK